MADNEIDAALAETKKAAKQLASSTARLTRHLLTKADRAAKDPKGSVRRAAHRIAQELESMSHDIEELLKEP